MQQRVPRPGPDGVASIRRVGFVRWRATHRNRWSSSSGETEPQLDPVHQEERHADLGVWVQELAVVLCEVDAAAEPSADDGERDELDAGMGGEPFLEGNVGTEVAGGD